MEEILDSLQDTAEETATMVFNKLDINNDGNCDEDEFVSGCMGNSTLAGLLNVKT